MDELINQWAPIKISKKALDIMDDAYFLYEGGASSFKLLLLEQWLQAWPCMHGIVAIDKEIVHKLLL